MHVRSVVFWLFIKIVRGPTQNLGRDRFHADRKILFAYRFMNSKISRQKAQISSFVRHVPGTAIALVDLERNYPSMIESGGGNGFLLLKNSNMLLNVFTNKVQ